LKTREATIPSSLTNTGDRPQAMYNVEHDRHATQHTKNETVS